MIIADAHCDTLSRMVRRGGGLYENSHHLDIQKLLHGGKGVKRLQVFAAFCGQDAGKEKQFILQQMEKFYDEMHMNATWISYGAMSDKIVNERAKTLSERAKELNEWESKSLLSSSSPISGLLSIEGLNFLNSEDADDQVFFENLLEQVVMIAPSWNIAGSICTTCMEEDDKGLSSYGRKVLQAMEKAGVFLDVSHMSRKSVEDAFAIYHAPVVASHSNAYQICKHKRNLTDEEMHSIAASGGWIGVNFYPPFLREDETRVATMEDVIRHIEYIAGLIGEDFVGLGSDFDGIDETPRDMQNAAAVGGLVDALLRRNYREQTVAKIMGENLIRVLGR